ncbi:hypothetical protein ZWY2020_037567 [Hordeum vulgare]|nr:hypothetical protein ZWY2020_037567 [Hordeum vulgare]
MERKESKSKTMSNGVPELKTYSATRNKGNPHVQPSASSSAAKAKAPSTATPPPASNSTNVKPANQGGKATKR